MVVLLLWTGAAPAGDHVATGAPAPVIASQVGHGLGSGGDSPTPSSGFRPTEASPPSPPQPAAQLVATAAITPNPSEAGAPVSVNGTVSGGAAPYGYSFYAGYGSIFTSGAIPSAGNFSFTVTYPTAGTWSWWLNVSDNASAYSTVANTTVVNAGPGSPMISASPSPTDEGVPVTFATSATGGQAPFSFSWSFGNGQSANGSSVATAYAVAGNYTIVANETDGAGAWVLGTYDIVVNPAPTVTIVATPSPADAANPVAFFAQYTGGTAPFTAFWDFGDGSVSTVRTPTHAFASAGTYSVTLDWNDSAGTSVRATTSLTVATVLNATFTVSNDSPLIGQPVYFQVNATGGAGPYSYSYVGLPIGCVSVNQPTIGCLATQSGNYTVTAQVRDANSGSANATVQMMVTFNFTVSYAPKIVLGERLTMEVTPAGIGPFTFHWQGLPPGCVANQTSLLSCVPTATGHFDVLILVGDGAGDIALRIVNVAVVPGPPGTSPNAILLSTATVLSLIAIAAVGAGLLYRRRRQKAAP